MGMNGVWLSIPAAELLALIVAVYYMVRLKERYRY